MTTLLICTAHALGLAIGFYAGWRYSRPEIEPEEVRMIPSFSPRRSPLELAGASRIRVLVRCHHRRLASMSFSCSRDDLAGYAQSNFAKAFEAFKSAISFRRLLVLHDRERNDHRSVKSWVSHPQPRKAESKCLT